MENGMRSFGKAAGIVAMLFVIAWPAFAQEISGSIRGTVTDATGATVSNVRLTVIQVDTGLQRSTTTNGQGAYLLVELPVGHYRLEADAKGFKKFVQGPAFQQWDFSAIKTIPIHESMNLQFRAEIFNIFNNVNFQLPNNDINSPGSARSKPPSRAESCN